MNGENKFEEEIVFEEEVNENLLHPISEEDDLKYIISPTQRRSRLVLIILVVLLIILALLALMFGVLGFGNEDNVNLNGANCKEIRNYTLSVTHSNIYNGGEQLKLEKYKSIDKAYIYRFNVTNENPVSLNYIINQELVDFSIKSGIANFQLVRDDEVILSGKMKEKDGLLNLRESIESGKTYKYSLKIWSSTFEKEDTLSFKINISI